MTRISAKKTFLYKTLAPVVVVAFLSFAAFSAFSDGTIDPSIWLIIGIGAIYASVGFLVYLAVRSLADEVNDCGDHLTIRRGSLTATVPLADVMNVQYSTWVARVPKITLRLAKTGPLGDQIAFLPASKFGLLRTNADDIFERLSARAYAANAKRGA